MKRKNIKKYVLPMIATSSLVPLTAVVAACSITNENVAVRKLTFLNDYSDSERAQLGAAAYRVSGNELIAGQENRITITFDKYSEISKVTSKQQYFEIYQTTPFKEHPGQLEEGKDYTVENPSKHVFIINFTAQQSKKIVKNMTIRFKAGYKYLRYGVELPAGDTFADSIDDWYTYNAYACYDFSFLLIPRRIELGYEASESAISKIKIIGVKEDSTEEPLTGVKIEKVLAYSKLQNTDSALPTQTHYLKVSIPLTTIFNIDENENFTKKYQKLLVKGEEECSLSQRKEYYTNKFMFNTTGCKFTGEAYMWDSEFDAFVYKGYFTADSGKKFDYDTTAKTVPFTSLKIKPKNSVFKEISTADGELYKMSDYYYKTEGVDFDYFLNGLDTIPKFQNWMQISPGYGGNSIRLVIDVRAMLKFTQMPTETIINKTKLTEFGGGSIDFLDYMFMNIVAVDE